MLFCTSIFVNVYFVLIVFCLKVVWCLDCTYISNICYTCHSNPLAQSAASLICTNEGGYLATIPSQDVETQLQSVLLLSNPWIGLSLVNEQYVWEDGTVLTYTDWDQGYPKSGQGSCVYFHTATGDWRNSHCNTTREFLCSSGVPGSAPEDFIVSGETSRTISVIWSPPPPGSQRGIITHYVITYFGHERDSAQRTFNVSFSVRNIELTGLEEFTSYSVSVAAATVLGSGPSSQLNSFTSEDVPSASPTSLTATTVSSHAISISWNPPPSIHINGIITSYTLTFRGVERDSTLRTLTLTDNSNAYQLTGLDEDTEYVVNVRANTAVGAGPCAMESNSTLEDIPSSPPRTLNALVLYFSGFVQLTWTAPNPDDVNGDLVSYRITSQGIERDTETKSYISTPQSDLSSEQVYRIYNLTFITTYVINVSAVTSVGDGPSESVMIIYEGEPTGPPLLVTPTPLSSSLISLNWDLPASHLRNGNITLYNITLYGIERDTSMRVISYTSLPLLFYFIHNLDANTTYQLAVAAATSIGAGPEAVVTVKTLEDVPSEPPGDISASATSSNSVNVSWTAPPADHTNGLLISYSIFYRGVSIDTEKRELVIPFSSLTAQPYTYEISSLQEFTVYEVQVSASTKEGSGPLASTDVTTFASAPSGAVEFELEAVSSTVILVSWLALLEVDRNGLVDQYSLHYRGVERDSETKTLALNFSVDSTLYSLLEDLQEFTTYNVSIRAVNSAGNGPFSHSSVITREDVPSSEPTNLTVSSLSSASIRVRWEAPLITDQNGVIVDYSLSYRGFVLDTSERMIHFPASDSNILYDYTITSLEEYTLYEIRVTAATSVGRGPAVTTELRTLQATPTGVPSNFTSSAVTPRTIYITWYAPPYPDLNGLLTRYTLTYQGLERDTEERIVNIPTEGRSNTSLTVTGLEENTTFNITIQAHTIIGAGPITSTTVLTPEDVPSSPVRVLTTSTTQLNATSILVSWSVPVLNDLNGVLLNYSVTYSGIEIDTTTRVIYLSNPGVGVQSITLTELQEYTTYSIVVAPFTMVGKGPDAIVTQRTNQDVPFAIPTNFRAISISPTIVSVTWDSPPIYAQNGVITNYTLTYRGVERDTLLETVVIPVVNGTSYIEPELTGLEENTNYNFELRANTMIGNGPNTQLTVKTNESNPEGIPSSLSARPISSTALNVTWSAPNRNLTDGSITGYAVKYFGIKLDTSIRIVRISDTSAILHDLQENTNYSISVNAATSVGFGPVASTYACTLEAVPSAEVLNLIAREASPYSVSISWDPPPFEHQNGRIINYTVVTTSANTEFSRWDNYTNETCILLRELFHSIPFTFTVTPYTAVGDGPSRSTQLELRPETSPMIDFPTEDEYTVEKDLRNFDRLLECKANGNPLPKITWTTNFDNITLRINSYNVDPSILNETGLTAFRFTCHATNRNASVTRLFTLVTEVDIGNLRDTIEQLQNETEISPTLADSINNIVDDAVNFAQLTEENNDTSTSSDEVLTVAGELYATSVTLVSNNRNSSVEGIKGNLLTTANNLVVTDENTLKNFSRTGNQPLSSNSESVVVSAILGIESLSRKLARDCYSIVECNSTEITVNEENTSILIVSDAIPNNTDPNQNPNATIRFPEGNFSNISDNIVFPLSLLSELNENNSMNGSVIKATTAVFGGITVDPSPNATFQEEKRASSVLSFGLMNSNSEPITRLPRKVNIMFHILYPVPNGYAPSCKFFNTSTSIWSTEGVELASYDRERGIITCETTHLTSFAVLFTPANVTINDLEALSLKIVSYILLCVTFLLILVAVCLICHGGFKFLKHDHGINQIYLNISIALLAGIAIFLVGIETFAANPNLNYLCILTSALIQYFFLAAFFWQLCAGIHIFQRVIIASLKEYNSIWLLYLIGWGFPLVPSIISCVFGFRGHVDATQICWIKPGDDLIWLFLGPLYFTLLLNLALLIITAFRIFRTLSDNKMVNFKKMLLSIGILSITLGIPWFNTLILLFTKIDRTLSFTQWFFILSNGLLGVSLLAIIIHRYRYFMAYRANNKPKKNTASKIDTTHTALPSNMPRCKPSKRTDDSASVDGLSISVEIENLPEHMKHINSADIFSTDYIHDNPNTSCTYQIPEVSSQEKYFPDIVETRSSSSSLSRLNSQPLPSSQCLHSSRCKSQGNMYKTNNFPEYPIMDSKHDNTHTGRIFTVAPKKMAKKRLKRLHSQIEFDMLTLPSSRVSLNSYSANLAADSTLSLFQNERTIYANNYTLSITKSNALPSRNTSISGPEESQNQVSVDVTSGSSNTKKSNNSPSPNRSCYSEGITHDTIPGTTAPSPQYSPSRYRTRRFDEDEFENPL